MERRNVHERSAKLQRVVNLTLENPSVTLRVETLGAWLNVQLDAAQRILSRMVSAGLLQEVQRGVFVAQSPC
jgi:predicted transcriptional regulator